MKKISKTVVKDVYVTDDGIEFDSKLNAIMHEEEIKLTPVYMIVPKSATMTIHNIKDIRLYSSEKNAKKAISNMYNPDNWTYEQILLDHSLVSVRAKERIDNEVYI